jgi:hypothetical protein
MSRRVTEFALAFLAIASLGLAQVTTTGIHGTVKDPSGAAIPGAALKAKDMATGIEKTTAATAEGLFVFANLQAGTYQVTASAAGFQSSRIDNILVDAGRTTDISISMHIGAVTETLEVSASAVQLETTTNEIGATINSSQIKELPYTSRDALNFALLMPGAQNTTIGSNSGQTFNGLPNASMNITLDGMNNNSQRFKSGGTSFYAFAPERLDAIEQVTVSTTGLGADAGADGAMQIRFTTKRGTDKYRGHVLYQANNEDFNANTYFNKLQGIHRSKTRAANYDGNFGGPLLPFIPYFKHKVFFFMNFEDVPSPGASTFSTTVLQPEMLTGNMTYLGTDGANHTVNVLNIAKAAGFPSTVDPTINGILNAISATQKSAIGYRPISGIPYEQTMLWAYATNTSTLYPTVRADYQITEKIGWHGTWNQRHANTIGTPNYPGGIASNNAYKIDAPVTTNVLDWTITPHLLNNFLFGTQGNMEYFYNPSDIHQWAAYGDRNISLGLINPLIANNTPWKRNNPVWQWTDNLTWVKGRHTVTMGGSVLRTSFYEQHWNSGGVLNVGFGISTNDPVGNIIQAGLPNINLSNTTDLNNAKSLYAMLTGRINSMSTSLNVDEITHQYHAFSPIVNRFGYITGGMYAQDSFRVKSNVSINYGMRWEFTGATHGLNGITSWPTNLWGPSSGPFVPGNTDPNYNPALVLADYPYKKDTLNPAPMVGITWSPSVDSGILSKIIGHGKTVISSSYNISYYNEGLNDISNLSGNAGSTQSQSAAAALAANPGAYNLTTPLPAFSTSPSSFSYPLSLSPYPLNGGTTLYYVNPNQRTPYVQAWNFRIQRELSRGTVLDVRYVGNKSTHLWHYQNMNETNILENGFLDQFKQAQQNLALNASHGVANNFSNQGFPGEGPLPIFEAAFGANGSNLALATSSGFGSSTFIQNLNQGAAGTLAGSLASTSSATYYCRLVGPNFAPCAAAGFGYTKNNGYPANFFRPQPYANTVGYQDDNGNTSYNGLQIEVRKNATRGLTLDAHYTFSHTLGTLSNLNDQQSSDQWSTLRNGHLDYGPTPFDHRHSFVNILTYDLPMGRGRLLNLNNKVLNAVLGNWTISDTTQISSGPPIQLTGGIATFNQFADGGVAFGNGESLSDLVQRTSSMTTGQFVSSCNCFKTNVSDILQANGSVNPKYYAQGQTPGVIGARIFYRGKTAFTLNGAATKRFRIKERYTLGLYAEASNFLNHPFFNQGNLGVTSTSFGNITGASGTRTAFVRAYFDF